MSGITNVSVNVSTVGLDTPIETGQTESTKPATPNLTVSIKMDVQNADGSSQTISLEYPAARLQDMDLNELEQMLATQLGSVNAMPLELTGAVMSTLALLGVVNDLANAIDMGGADFVKANGAALTAAFTSVERQATATMETFTQLYSSSSYPDANEFLKLMLETAMELKQMASEAKTAAMLGEADTLANQAGLMRDAAEKNYESTMKSIQAEKTQAWISLGISVVSLGFSSWGLKVAGTNDAISQSLNTIGRTLTETGQSFGTLSVMGLKTDSAQAKLEADLLGAAIKGLEANQKTQQAQQETLGELRDIAKQLQDFVLSMMRDFISSQSQIISKANV